MRSEQEICRHRSKKSLFGSVSFRYKFMHYLLFSVALWITGSGTMAFAGEPLNSAPVANLHNLVAASSTSSASEEVEDAATLDDLADSDELYGDDEYVKAAEQSVADPLYWFNYAMFSFNDKLYFWLLKPVARGYRFITPTPLRTGIRNFFHNSLFPLRFANNILQGKGGQAASEVKSFVINTVGGGLGFATPAQSLFGIKTYREDLGQTFGHYSVKEGFYLVLPLMGASTLRDAVGSVGDFFLSPTTYIESTELAVGVAALDRINAVSFRIGDYEAIKSAALDPYVAIKDGYVQMRRKQIKE